MRRFARKALTGVMAILLFILTLLTGCGTGDGLDPKNPVELTMWHNYGGVMKDTMVTLIDEFNNTVGRERGIKVVVTAIAASKEQNDKLTLITEGVPGAPEMPDIVTAYPSMALTLKDAALIAELDAYFTEDELDAYLPRFVEEGRLPDGKLYVFPIAKSTEALFVNKTFFERFSAGTGVELDSLATFEGLAAASVKYYEWTDAQTPDAPGDGKTFFTADSWFNIALVGTAQLGGTFVGDGRLNTDAAAYRRVWDFSVPPALSGGYAVIDGYSSDYYKTGEIAACIGSTAGVLFYGDTVIYDDNTSEAIESIVLPYPVFEGGQKIALQRGAGMVVAKSEPKKELAATVFLKWLAAPEQNMRFVSETGYLPVTKQAFDEKMTGEIGAMTNPTVKMLLEAAVKTYHEYDFITAPNVPDFDALSKQYETDIKAEMKYNG
ncbi:MAG: extracellular solute-binding protein [Clostridiales bacterium]|jgi:multiple sugar transport system substrate-binding protein|nr:extracellular solute-binding protein [Clostridiales bacterium]